MRWDQCFPREESDLFDASDGHVSAGVFCWRGDGLISKLGENGVSKLHQNIIPKLVFKIISNTLSSSMPSFKIPRTSKFLSENFPFQPLSCDGKLENSAFRKIPDFVLSLKGEKILSEVITGCHVSDSFLSTPPPCSPNVDQDIKKKHHHAAHAGRSWKSSSC